MTLAGRSIRSQARQIARRTGQDEGEVINHLVVQYASHIRQKGIAGITAVLILLAASIAVMLFVPADMIASRNAKEFFLVGTFAIGGNLFLGIAAVSLKTTLGYRWGYVEIAGALLAAVALAVQLHYGSRTDYGIWLLAELAAIFGIVKGFDTIDRGLEKLTDAAAQVPAVKDQSSEAG